MGKYFGIDLGTTYSCIATVDEFNKPIILRNRDGEATTPSVVLIEEDGSYCVGRTAKEDLSGDESAV